jgi:hypothetical protein
MIRIRKELIDEDEDDDDDDDDADDDDNDDDDDGDNDDDDVPLYILAERLFLKDARRSMIHPRRFLSRATSARGESFTFGLCVSSKTYFH